MGAYFNGIHISGNFNPLRKRKPKDWVNTGYKDLQAMFEKETGSKAIVFPVCHGETGFAAWDYQLWLENIAISKTEAQLCPKCSGEGILPNTGAALHKICDVCNGAKILYLPSIKKPPPKEVALP